MRASLGQPRQFTPELRNRLKITVLGLGLVRLLLDADRTKEAQATLRSLQKSLDSVQAKKRNRQARRASSRKRSCRVQSA
jgi:hypothetical protein